MQALSLLPLALNCLMSIWRCTRLVEPSSRACAMPRSSRKTSMMSSIEVHLVRVKLGLGLGLGQG